MEKPVIGIIGGTGKMGTFFRHLFEKEGLKVLIAGRDTKLTYQQLCLSSDIVMICVPVEDAPGVIEKVIPFLSKEQLLVDLSSLQTESFIALSKYSGPHVGIHALFGPLVSSIENQVFVFTPSVKNEQIQFLTDFFTQNGAKVFELSAKEHDQQMAQVQALVHFTNISLALTLSQSATKINKELTTPLFRLQQLVMGRVFGQSSHLYENITMQNPQFAQILKSYQKNVIELSKTILAKDKSGFTQLFNSAKDWLGSFIPIAENKTTEILNLIDRQPVKLHASKLSVSASDAKIAFLGPMGTYSHEVAVKIFPKSKDLIPVKTISEVFDFVNSHQADFGIVPTENIIEGVVKETLGNLIDYPIEILASYILPIEHYLISYGKNIEKITTIRSHPQALGQCKNWIRKNLPQAKIETANSTVSSILETTDPTVAFISPKQAVTAYHLNILAKDIGDKSENQTEFYVISEGKSNLFNHKKEKAILLLSVYDRVGILRDILDVFATKGLNLSKIISIPSGGKVGEYMFLIEVSIVDNLVSYKGALKKLNQYCHTIRILGEI